MEDNQIQELWNEYKELLLSTKRPNIENLIKWLDESDFKVAPASTQYHNNFKGGLLQHSLNVYYAAKDDFKHWIDFFELSEESIVITSLLHDICKVNCYDVSMRNTKNENGQWIQVPFYLWNEQEPLGHGTKSVMLINEYGVQLTKVERAMIVNHMGFTSNDDERRVSKLFRICPQSLILHCADLEATMILESYDGPQRYIDKLTGHSLAESMNKQKETTPASITILGTEYKLAPANAVVDDEKIIEVDYCGSKVKVYSPFGDGLPF
jgi:hypothetical protein